MPDAPKDLWVIMASGTGGHVIPALAMARALQQEGYAIRWLGTVQGIEQQLVAEAGIVIDTIPMVGIRGKGLWRWITAPFILLSALRASIRLLKAHRPVAVLGFGGFVTGPGGLAAYSLRIPLVIHEQNAIPGLANRLLKPFAKRIMASFPKTFARSSKVRETGNPVRPDILAVKPHEFKGKSLKLLVMGGSLGARTINEAVVQLCIQHPNMPLEIWHQTGPKDFERVQSLVRQGSLLQIKSLVPFIGNVSEAYEWADMVLCRAGAMTVFELAAAGRASILVPYPHAVDDHQTANARYLSHHGAAVLVPDQDLNANALYVLLQDFMAHPEKITRMSEHARTMAQPNATQKMVDICLEVCSL
jgi:UDP-N-acetylglucosamine--N-acetylmuramyl-(pentapeptide) pyrophosphoryl-undecaprenol N-acetylglucosamine transferase